MISHGTTTQSEDSRKRDRMKRTAKASRKSTDWSKYKNLRNNVNNVKKTCKRKLETNLIKLNCNDEIGFCKIIKHFIKENISCFPPLSDIYYPMEIKFGIFLLMKSQPSK